jgi:L-proline amide hydrolase
VHATLAEHEAQGSYDDPAYLEACLVFYGRHVCRIPWPPDVSATFEWLERDPTVYRTMNGPSEFHVIGSCKDWQVKDRLHEIRRPTLVVSGRYDETTPALQQVLLEGIAGSEWVCFEESSHMPHVEERERYMQVVGDFLARHD